MPPASRIPHGTGARIKARRKELGLTQKRVAQAVAARCDRDYGESWLAQIEREKGSMLLDAAIAMADVLGMSMDVMLGRRVGPDIVLEADGTTVTAVEVKQPLVDAAVAPLEGVAQSPGSDAPIPLEPARRGRKRAASPPQRT